MSTNLSDAADLPDLSDLTVIFDLDGTLVDSAPDLAGAMNAVLRAEGLPELDVATVRHLVGEGARALLRRGFAEAGRAFPETEEGDAHVAAFLAHYADNLTNGTDVFPGVLACLDDLGRAGAALAVCTNKPHGLAVAVLEGLGLTGRFAEVLGRESLPTCKPDPAPLLEILRRTKRRRGVMIGDTMTDLRAGRAANMPVFITGFGYGTEDAALWNELGNAEERFDDFEALFGMITGLKVGLA